MTTLAEWESYFTAESASGVAWGLDPALNTTARAATMKAGGALLRGIYKPLNTGASVPIPAAASQNRVDRLVLRLNRDATTPAEFVKPVVLTGTPSSTPAIPALQQTTGSRGLWDLPISRWTSQSNGSITGLVDERFWLGNAPILYNSTARPTPSRRTLGLELDTGRLTRWDGSTWRSIIEDSGDLPLTLKKAEGINDYGWAAAGSCLCRRIGGTVSLVLHAKYVPPKTMINYTDYGVLVGTIPAALRPRNWQHFTTVTSDRVVTRVEIRTSGEIWAQNVRPPDFSLNSTMRLTMTYVL